MSTSHYPRPLSVREDRLLDKYIANGGNGTDAAREAGYKGSPDVLKVTASRVLTRANVKAELERRQAAIAKRNDITIDDIVRRLDAEAHGAKDASARIRALELLGKHLGMFPRGDINVHIDARQQVLANLAGMTTEQLLRLADDRAGGALIASETMALESGSA